MKNFVRIFAVLSMIAGAMVSCNKEPAPDDNGDESNPDPTPENVTLELTASSSEFFEFKPSDAIKLFSEPEEISKRFRTTEGGKTALFRATLDKGLQKESYNWYAIYPFNDNVIGPDSYVEKGFFNIGLECEQHGLNSTGHIYGKNAPMYAKTSAPVAKDEKINLEFQDIAAYMQIDVKNATDDEIAIENITITAKDAIVGKYYVKFKNDLELIPYEGETSNVATLSVLQAKLGAGESGSFYIPVVPFTAKASDELLIAVNGVSKKAKIDNDLVFDAGKTTVVNYEANAIGAFSITGIDINEAEGSISLNWSAAENAEKYVVSYKVDGEFKTVDNGTETSVKLTSLAHGYYTFTVTAEAEGCASRSISTETIIFGDEYKPENLTYALLNADGSVYENVVYYADLLVDKCDEEAVPHTFQEGCKLGVKLGEEYVSIAEIAEKFGAPESILTPEYTRSYVSYGRSHNWTDENRVPESDEKMGGPYNVIEASPYGYTVVINNEPKDCPRHLNYLNRYIIMKGKWGFNLGKEDEIVVFETEDVFDMFWFMGRGWYNKQQAEGGDSNPGYTA